MGLLMTTRTRRITTTRMTDRPASVDISLGAPGGPARVRLSSGLLAPRLVSVGPGRARVALVATGALLLGGDSVRLEVRVGAGARLDLIDVAGTVAYNGRGRGCAWSVRVELDEGAVLTWPAEPFVVAEGAIVRRDLHADLALAARALLRDVLVLGRHGERSGSLFCRTRVRLDGVDLLAEDLDLDIVTPGVLGASRVLDTVSALGWRPGTPPAAVQPVFELAGPGAVARSLSDEAHRAPGKAVWDAFLTGLDLTTTKQ